MAKPKTTSLTLNFENHEALNHFWRWLCESGEQNYWEYMEYREQEEDGDITGLQFDYRKADNGNIQVKCGRFTGEPSSEEYKEEDAEV